MFFFVLPGPCKPLVMKTIMVLSGDKKMSSLVAIILGSWLDQTIEVADIECTFCRYTEDDDSREFPAGVTGENR